MTQHPETTASLGFAHPCKRYFSHRNRDHPDKDGRDVYTTEIVASEMQMLGTKPDDGRPPAKQRAGMEAPHPAGTDDDIPF